MAAVRDPAAHHGPAQGHPELRTLVAANNTHDTGLAWTADDIPIARGAKHTLLLAITAQVRAVRQELGTEFGALAGQAQDHLGVRMLAKSGLDEGVEFRDLLIKGHHSLRETGHHGSGQLLAGPTCWSTMRCAR